MVLFGYKFFVIDHGWEHLINVNDFLKQCVDKNFSVDDEDIEFFQENIITATNRFKQAKILAKNLGWEGDFRCGPSLFFIPDPDRNYMNYGFVFKQYNNGMTFVISPIQLEHLYEYEDVETQMIEY